jgi:hypothetical protein
MKRIALLGLAVVALFAMSVTVASAKKAGLKLHTAKIEELPAGAEIVGFSSNLVFKTEKGNLECTESELKGKLEVNNETKDKGKIESDREEGAEAEKLCKSGLGPVKIEVKKLPWSEEFGSTGKEQTKGKKITFKGTFPGLGGISCIYETSTVKGVNTTTGQAKVTVTNQKFKSNKSESNAACPKEGTLSGEFAFSSGGEEVLA